MQFCFCRLLDRQALAADGDALLTKHGGHPGFGDPEVGAYLFGGFAAVVPTDDVIDIGGGAESASIGWECHWWLVAEVIR